jgi:hypothetical protein
MELLVSLFVFFFFGKDSTRSEQRESKTLSSLLFVWPWPGSPRTAQRGAIKEILSTAYRCS